MLNSVQRKLVKPWNICAITIVLTVCSRAIYIAVKYCSRDGRNSATKDREFQNNMRDTMKVKNDVCLLVER